MVILLFTSIVIILLVAVVYLWQKPSSPTLDAFEAHPPLPPSEPRSLFAGGNANQDPELGESAPQTTRELLLKRAASGDNTALDEAQKNFDRNTYDEILAALVLHADSDARLLSVLTHVTRNELPISKALAEAGIRSWKKSPDRGSTSRTFHITALADDPGLYQATVDSALEFFRKGILVDVSAAELRALFDGEYWVLSSETRSSGAGFILKRSLAKARRELEAAMAADK